MKTSLLKISLAIVFFTTIILGYMNCGDAKLTKKSSTLASITSPSSLSGNLCAQNSGAAGKPKKIVFIVDMSFSNIGECFGQAVLPSKGTDHEGKRFDKIKEFMENPTCDNGTNEYAILAFSKELIDPTTNQVSKQFINRADLNKSNIIQKLKDINTVNSNLAKTPGISCATFENSLMKSTSYSKALEALDELIRDDLSKTALTAPNTLKDQHYFAYFISDGAPTNVDGNAEILEGDDPLIIAQNNEIANGYAHRVQDIVTVAKEMTGGMLLQTVYYNRIVTPGHPDEPQLAKDFQKADIVLSKMTIAGGTDSTKNVGNIQGADLCSFAATPDRFLYQPINFTIVNLTAKMKEGVLLPDSDADGVLDRDESSFGIPKGIINRRNNKYHLLDSVCVTKRCKEPGVDLSSMSCEPTKESMINIDPYFAISKCDEEAMGLSTSYLDGESVTRLQFSRKEFGDGIPDIIEIIKGSLAGTHDANNIDGPGLTIKGKIQKGRQPYYDESDLKPPIGPELEVKVSLPQVVKGSTVCDGGKQAEYSFSVSNNPLVPTVAYNAPAYINTDGNSVVQEHRLSHAAGENVMMAYFYSIPANKAFLDVEIWAYVFKMKFGVKENIRIKTSDFELVGPVRGK
ncbi:MAG: hypothetical protein SGI74_08315 [Oligoflexia bacterium]|nr:hypothetical protein [Oligoflexia bacterium]